MNDKPAETAAPIDYKGRHIELTPHQQPDGTWVCQYAIMESGNPQMASSKGSPDGSFPSREAAELAALQKAKALIDFG